LAQIPRDNAAYTIIANNIALGESEGTAQIAISREQNIGWNTMVPGFMAADAQKETQEVSVSRLDDYLKAKSIDRIALIKIDTEGFELPVLKGLSRYLQNTAHRPAILCEIAPAAYQLMNSSLRDLEEYLRQWGYNSFTLVDTGRNVVLAQLMETTNVLIRKR
jgi:FkbM family methyltransferase